MRQGPPDEHVHHLLKGINCSQGGAPLTAMAEGLLLGSVISALVHAHLSQLATAATAAEQPVPAVALLTAWELAAIEHTEGQPAMGSDRGIGCVLSEEEDMACGLPAGQPGDSTVAKMLTSAASVVGRLSAAVAAGKDALLLLPVYSEQLRHFVAGVLDMKSGELRVFDSWDPGSGSLMPRLVAGKVQWWQAWLTRIGCCPMLGIQYDAVSQHYTWLGQHERASDSAPGWDCGCYTAWNLMTYAAERKVAACQDPAAACQAMMEFLEPRIKVLADTEGAPCFGAG